MQGAVLSTSININIRMNMNMNMNTNIALLLAFAVVSLVFTTSITCLIICSAATVIATIPSLWHETGYFTNYANFQQLTTRGGLRLHVAKPICKVHLINSRVTHLRISNNTNDHYLKWTYRLQKKKERCWVIHRLNHFVL